MSGKKYNILILGGGYGGLRVALKLQNRLPKESAQITLVSKHDYHYQTTLLHKVAIGTLSSRKARIYYRKILDLNKVKFIKDKVTDIDPKMKIVSCKRSTHTYDFLVIGLGFKTDNFGIDGVDKYAYKLQSLNSALKLTKNIENKFKDFCINGDANDLSIIICGTGFTGIEFTAELATQIDELCQICGIDRSIPKITCVGRSSNILPIFPKDLSAVGVKKLEKLGVNIINNAEIKEIKQNGIIISRDGKDEFIKGNTILWSCGVKGNDVIEQSIINNKKGRIPVDEHLRSFEYREIFVVGDCALAKSKDVIHAPTAQLSAQMGDFVGEYIANIILDKPNTKSFQFIHRGTICSIGHTDGIGVVFKRQCKGEFAAFMKNTIENRWLMSIGGIGMVFKKGQFRYRTSN